MIQPNNYILRYLYQKFLYLFLCFGLLILTNLSVWGTISIKETGVQSDSLGQKRVVTNESTLPKSVRNRLIHRISMEYRPGRIIPTHSILRDQQEDGVLAKTSESVHLRYGFKYADHSSFSRIFGDAYQGIGIARYHFDNEELFGDPIAFYLFQGARILRISSFLSFFYEWNFGLTTGWHPYDPEKNPRNLIIGSKINAYMNTNFYFNWQLSSTCQLKTGIAFTHFSNGNTQCPNAGLNLMGLQLGLACNLYRQPKSEESIVFVKPAFKPHMSYDLVFFGSWRRKAVVINDYPIVSPKAYPVAGFNFAPMFHVGYKFRIGLSLDGVYDGSANAYTLDESSEPEFSVPPTRYQMALGLSGRAEFVMPHFSLCVGMGGNMIYSGTDLKGFYQILALKIAVTRNSFLHVGYNLQNFEAPNYLMLGIGFRFNNKYPKLSR